MTTETLYTASVQASSSNNDPVGPLVILGEAMIGNTLIARPNGIKDADGINYNTDTFQWLRDGDPIPGATDQSYSVTYADSGAELSVRYIYSDLGGNQEVVTSKPESAVPNTPAPTQPTVVVTTYVPGPSDPNNNDPVGPMNILGDAVVGETLTARPNGIKDADGIDYKTATFQWLRDGDPIQGATGQTYEVGLADRGAEISVQYIYLDQTGRQEVVTSKPEAPVPGAPVVTPPQEPVDKGDDEETPTTPDAPADPVNVGPIGALVVLGYPVVGAELTARNAIFDADGYDTDEAEYQWLRDGQPIEGANAAAYRLTNADAGTDVSLQLSYTDNGGTDETVYSNGAISVDPGSRTEEPVVIDRAPTLPSTDEEEPAETPDAAPVGDPLLGTPDDDVLTAVAGVPLIDGLAGTDTAFFEGDQSNYVVSLSADGVSVTDRTDGGLGTIELDNVELIDFGTGLPAFGGAMDLGQFGGHTGLGEEAFESFVEMYIAYFNRAPDAVGLAFWGSAYADGMSLEEIAAQFADQPETLETYPADAANVTFTSNVYSNVLGRSPDIDGLRFWTSQLDEGNVSRGEFILEVLRGVKADAPADASQAFVDRQLADQAYLEQKTDLGAFFSVHKGMSNVDDAAMVLALFDGSDASVGIAVDAINSIYDASMDSVNGEFLMPLVGVLDDPFTV